MILFERFTLDNGLKVVVNTDTSTPFVAFNMLYDVGSKDEEPDKTGFAHLFEHLMFGGSAHIPNFDTPIQLVGGENNAFTNTDITNYYMLVPKNNIETAFWLESDRMLELDFSQKNLDTQKHVVIEEFKQRYLNKPYGDLWMLLRPLAYKVHPYSWATIGKEISHIENADLEYVRSFFYSHYAPNNAILSLSGNITRSDAEKLCTKWFGPIRQRLIARRNLPKEPKQTEARHLSVERNVPFNVLMKSYHICDRDNKQYYATDLISDILSNGNSSRLYRKLVKEKQIFADVHAFISGEIEEGLLTVNGSLLPGISFEEAEDAILAELNTIRTIPAQQDEFDKILNKLDSTMQFGAINILNKAMSLAKFELIGNADLINTEIEEYRAVTPEQLCSLAHDILTPENCSTIYYASKPTEQA